MSWIYQKTDSDSRVIFARKGITMFQSAVTVLVIRGHLWRIDQTLKGSWSRRPRMDAEKMVRQIRKPELNQHDFELTEEEAVVLLARASCVAMQ